MKKKLKVLVLFDGTSPTTVDQDFSDELKTKESSAAKTGDVRARCPFQSGRTIQEQV